MRRSLLLRTRRRAGPRRALAAGLALSLAAGLLVTGVSPAGAQSADLVTENGIGLRVDETALTGPALDAIEEALQPMVDQMVLDGAAGDDAPFQDHHWVNVNTDLQLDVSFSEPGGSRPDGGLDVQATIADIEIEWRMTGLFWIDCSIFARPDDGTVAIGAGLDRSKLPGNPVTLEPVQATWDDDPDVDFDWPCAGHVVWQAIVQWWDGIWDSSDPESTASRIERELNDTAQELVDDLWDEHVQPVLGSLDAFGLSINQLRTDAHGLIVTADLDATDLTLPEIGGPFDVSGAADSGVDTDVDALLAQRTNAAGDSHVIATVHPNIVNQFVYAINQVFSGNLGSTLPGAEIEEVLLDPSVRDNYDDGAWSVSLVAVTPPHTEPTGSGGRPQLQIGEVRLEVHNASFHPFFPVATFGGSLGGVDLVTEIREGSTDWGPALSSDNLTTSLALTDGNADVLAWNPDPAALAPYVGASVDSFNDFLLVGLLSLAPIRIGDLSVDLCEVDVCGRYAGDERYTETFLVS